MNSSHLIAEIQHILSPADQLLRWLSLHTYSTHYLAITVILYWSGFFTMAARLACGLLFSTLLFSSGRFLFASPRPYYEYPQLFNGISEKIWGMPSGHSQNAIVFWGLTFWMISLQGYRLLALIMMLLIPVSRLYLGVHYPNQILAGIGAGLVLLFFMIHYESSCLIKLRSLNLLTQLLITTCISILPLAFVLILNAGMGVGPSVSDILPYKRMFFYTGLLGGVACSLVLAYACTTLSDVSPSWRLLLIRAIPGFLSLALLWRFKMWLPACIEIPIAIYLLLWFQGVFIGLWCCILWPLLHQRCMNQGCLL